ncbi:MAG: radical SAM protein [Chloroflexota bacterium]
MTPVASRAWAGAGDPLSAAAQRRAAAPRGRAGAPLRDLRVSVTDRCNFRCSYCPPPDAGEPRLVARDRLLSFEQIARVAEAAADLGVHKVRLTGGEPLLRRGCPPSSRCWPRIRGLGEVALTTNGWLLERPRAASPMPAWVAPP